MASKGTRAKTLKAKDVSAKQAAGVKGGRRLTTSTSEKLQVDATLLRKR